MKQRNVGLQKTVSVLLLVALLLTFATPVFGEGSPGVNHADSRALNKNNWEYLYKQAWDLTNKAFQTNDSALRSKLLQESIHVYEMLLESYPNDVNARNNMAANLYQLGRYDEALIAFSELIQLFPNFPPAYQNRSVLYEKLDRKADALADYSIYLDLISNNDDTSGVKDSAAKIETPSPDGFWVWGDWYGQVNAHNYVYNGVKYVNAYGWMCGYLYPGVTDVENIVYFTLPSSVSNSTAYRQMFGTWYEVDWIRNYCGWNDPPWTCWPGQNYFMLVPEREVCAGYNAAPWAHKIHGLYWAN